MNSRKRLTSVLIFAIVVALIVSLSAGLKGCFRQTSSRTFFAADTVCTITVYGTNNEKALDGGVDLVLTLSNMLNCKDENSELYKLNKTGEIKNPSPQLLEVINYGIYFSKEGNGIFDITVKPLSLLWDFKNETVPNKTEISKALTKINYKNIEVSENSITLKKGSEIDLGAIAKGYIAEKTIYFLEENGVKSGIVNLGGNVSVIGENGGKDFSVGIQNPFKEDIAATVKCRDMSVVTSGIYQRYFEKKGNIYHHLLNTKTGYPEQNGLYSVTIISPSATSADALSTLCFLQGLEKGREYIENIKDAEAVFITENYEIHLTSGLKKQGDIIEILKGDTPQ